MVTWTPQLLEALIAADERELWWLGEEPTYDPDLSRRWRAHRERLERELAMFRELRSQGVKDEPG